MSGVFHLLGLHMHQPPGNLALLVETNPWEAQQILLCYARPLKYARRYPEVARFCVGFSGILLEQLQDPYVVARYAHVVDIPRMLDEYRNTPNIEIVGMGYYHPVFPLIPPEDWEDQVERGKRKILEVFGREPRVFWPPELAFTMEMIPVLVRHGYQYVVVDGVHVRPKEGLEWEDVPYHPHWAEYGGARMVVVPRDRDLSNAQQSGLDPAWFDGQVQHKTARARRPCLVTTWTDGENGGWFRQIHEEAGFWGHFFAPYMERVRAGQMPIRPISLSEYVREHPPVSEVQVERGAWSIGPRGGKDFSQWAGSPAQQQALRELWEVSRRYHEVRRWAEKLEKLEEAREKLGQAREAILRAETSCYLFWGDAWIPQLYAQTETARRLLEEVERRTHRE
ncbi:MAG: polysaccharide deacetylase family protein [Armatimonadota bacterium]|nr:polysaccharide deacetylase family protein [Armatimonadota bacterium]